MYRVRVRLVGEERFVENDQRFETIEDAKTYGRNLSARWTIVEEWDVRDNADKLFYWTEVIR